MRLAAILAVVLCVGCAPTPARDRNSRVPGGDATRGAEVIRSRACGGCHRIPGIRGADVRSGQALLEMHCA